MKFITGITRFFYTLILVIVGAALIVISLNLVPKEKIIEMLNLIYNVPNFRLITGLAGLLLISVSLLVMQLAMGRLHREKTIAFENPDGQVTVALSAIENFLKGLVKHIPQIKELKPNIVAGKKGIIIDTKVTLYSDLNIPNVTETIQSIVKSRVQDMLGIEEAIVVKVNIAKIIQKEEPKKKKKEKEKKEETQFQGIQYGA